MFEERISQKEAQRVRQLSESQILEKVTVSDGVHKPCSISGVEVELEWDNPHSMIISHLWIDPKIRNEGIGHLVTKKIINETKSIERIETIFATVQASNGGTKYLLKEKLGFSNVESQEDEYFGELVEGQLYL